MTFVFDYNKQTVVKIKKLMFDLQKIFINKTRAFYVLLCSRLFSVLFLLTLFGSCETNCNTNKKIDIIMLKKFTYKYFISVKAHKHPY